MQHFGTDEGDTVGNVGSIFSRLALAAAREIFKHYRMLNSRSDNITSWIILNEAFNILNYMFHIYYLQSINIR